MAAVVHHAFTIPDAMPFMTLCFSPAAVVMFRLSEEEYAQLSIRGSVVKRFFMGSHLCPIGFALEGYEPDFTLAQEEVSEHD